MISSRISSGFRGRPGLGGLAVGFASFAQRQKGPVGNDGDNVLELGAEWFAELDELGPLRGRDLDPFGQLGTQDTVLGKQVFDELSQLLCS